MRAKSLTWARKVGPVLMVGLFMLLSGVETLKAQPRTAMRGGPSVRGQVGRGLGARPRIRRDNMPGRRAVNPPHGQPGHMHGAAPGMRRMPRMGRGRRPGRMGRGRRPGRMGRGRPGRMGRRGPMARRVKASPTAAKAPVKATKVKKPSLTEAQRVAKLKAANRGKGVVGAVNRKTKTKGGLMNQILFYILFSLILCFSLVTITRKSPLMAALSLLVVFLGLAGVYLFLQAPFMAAIQLIVYAGAVIILFVFVIMSIGFDDDRDIGDLGKEVLYFAMAFMLTGAGAFVFHAGTGIAYIAGFAAMELLALAFIVLGKLRYPVTRFLGIAAVTFALAQVVRLVQMSPVLIGKTVGLKTHLDAPTQAYAAPADGSFGNARAIGQSVFTDNVFAFEALSLLLLAAIVAAVVIVRSRKETEEQTS